MNIRQSAFTLTEMTAVVAIIVIFVSMAMPAFTNMIRSNRTGQAKSVIKSYFAVAKARAAQTQNYVGIRFQYDVQGWKLGLQYMTLIEKNKLGTTYEYNAVPNTKPVALPKAVGLIAGSATGNLYLDDELTHSSASDYGGMNSATTFSVIFSPTGQLVIKTVLVQPRWVEYSPGTWIIDKIFNLPSRVQLNMNDPEKSMFYCDDGTYDPTIPLWIASLAAYEQEPSESSFYIFETEAMSACDQAQRWSSYVQTLDPLLVNMYTGTIFDETDLR